MLVISRVSLLPFAAAALAAFLAASSWRLVKRGNRMGIFFFLLNLATMLWSLFYAVELNLDLPVVLDVVPIGSQAYFVYVLEILGLSAAPVYWFLFSAEFARKASWTRGWRLWLAHLPLVYTFAVAVTNPLHELYVTQANDGAVGYGPLAFPSLLATFILVGWGTWLLIGSLARPGTQLKQRQALILGIAAVLPFLGGLAWALRHVLGLPLTVHPVPLLFALLNSVLLWQVFRTGFADIVPVAALQAFRTMSDAAIVISEDRLIAAMNPSAEKLLPGVEPGVLLESVDSPVARKVVEYIETHADHADFELSLGGCIYWGRFRRTLDRRGSTVGYTVLMTDVTELRDTQAQLEDLNLQLRHRVRQLDLAHAKAEERGAQLAKTVRQLEEASQAKSRFLANVSHELRTPLNAIIGFSGIMLDGLAGDLSDEQYRQIEMINSSGRRLLGLIGDILDLSRIEAGRIEIRAGRVDIRQTLESVMAQSSALSEEKGLSLTAKLPDQDITLLTDPGRLEQILINLVVNAIKYTDTGGVEIEVIPRGHHLEMRVADSGVGIPADALDRVFLEFEQVAGIDGSQRPGVGLGLSISQKIAELLGGRIEVESVVGKGSVFTLTLPWS